MGRPFVDLTDERFGKLVAIKYVGKDDTTKNHYRLWLCQCDCGNQKTVKYRDLVRAHTTSCGCIAQLGLTAGGSNKLDYGEARFHDLYLSYQRRATARKVEFTLSREQFRVLTKSDCFYCSLPPSQIIKAGNQGVNGEYVYNGIDRVDSSLGYTPENTRSACKFCNVAKASMTEAEFYTWIGRIYECLAARQARFEHGESG